MGAVSRLPTTTSDLDPDGRVASRGARLRRAGRQAQGFRCPVSCRPTTPPRGADATGAPCAEAVGALLSASWVPAQRSLSANKGHPQRDIDDLALHRPIAPARAMCLNQETLASVGGRTIPRVCPGLLATDTCITPSQDANKRCGGVPRSGGSIYRESTIALAPLVSLETAPSFPIVGK
jgi:hypothetical protein